MYFGKYIRGLKNEIRDSKSVMCYNDNDKFDGERKNDIYI